MEIEAILYTKVRSRCFLIKVGDCRLENKTIQQKSHLAQLLTNEKTKPRKGLSLSDYIQLLIVPF